ncbi:GatB/YqeY domain-containing protein [Lindgomyces ingoldianus]|uniref:GatB/YqeY domain-containing protein n=1 Tax=Lindgomyces ingoldianus TaxID=673940 RepID=A0ACB6RBF8_9PLEO|nr:GatB/YqeY domain-containing protein [Lindgomyces ingoldianus]KAF2475806.1 GatB/YqeY domain-containing protein [Lindgomyces ingoldianus]
MSLLRLSRTRLPYKSLLRRSFYTTPPLPRRSFYTTLPLPRPSFCITPPLLRRSFCTIPPLLADIQPTILPRLQSDLKIAMRSKDKQRLNVLRSLLAEITNASKTAKPIQTDGQLLSLVQKHISSSQQAIDEFEKARRLDLVEKEQGQVDILQAYVDEIPKLGEAEVDGMVEDVMRGLQAKPLNFGSVMRGMVEVIQGRPVDMEYVRTAVRKVTGGK